MSHILEIKNITKRYEGHTALDDVSFLVPEGCVFGLLGPNGAGKTTLIRIINQIIMSDEGEVLFHGEKLKPFHILQMGYLPEERGLYKKMGVAEQLVYLAQLKGMSLKEAKEQAAYWLKKLDLWSWRRKKIEDLSKGMQQKVQFISTVMHNPKLIILDEPFSGFDPINAQLIQDEILTLRDKGATIIFSTHRMESVEELCDEITLINHSKNVLNGTKKEIKQKFKDNTFEVIVKSPVSFDHTIEVIEESVDEDGHYYYLLHLLSGTANDLLYDLLPKTEVISLNEKIPSVHDIFIKVVNKKNENSLLETR